MGVPTSADMIRAMFLARLSAMCKSEMPRYRAMIEVVARVNAQVLAAQPEPAEGGVEAQALDVERHGAVRVGTAAELLLLRRLFAVMGMAPVGYYDLSVAGLPVHSTAFRPTTQASLRHCPFRVFVSLLRLDLIPEAELRDATAAILAHRSILTPRGLELFDQFDRAGGFDEAEAREFVGEAIETFRWRPEATVSRDVYRSLKTAHPILADIACFVGPHINHLAAPTLDIDKVQHTLSEQAFEPKEIIEGPPRRSRPILLRQTSFKALAEPIEFPASRGGGQATHSARFGEVEQRGAALTSEGRALYDRLLSAALAKSRDASAASNPAVYEQELTRQFKAFPDDDASLWAKGLAFFRYRPTAKGIGLSGRAPTSIERLLSDGHLSIEPILYEDFLPASAAGIFRSNLSDAAQAEFPAQSNRQSFEDALGCAVIDPQSLYAAIEAESLTKSLEVLNAPRALPRVERGAPLQSQQNIAG